MSDPVAGQAVVVEKGPAQASPAGLLHDDRPVIVCFGDSITAGYGLDTNESYPAWMQRQFDADGLRYRVVNMGVSGETTKDGLQRVDHVLALKPVWVVLEFGGNDGLRGLPVATTQKNLIEMVRELRRGGAKVLVAGITLPPQYGPEYVKQFTAIYPAVAAATSAPLVKLQDAAVHNVTGDMQDDGIHPTAKGAEQLAKYVGQSLEPMLGDGKSQGGK